MVLHVYAENVARKFQIFQVVRDTCAWCPLNLYDKTSSVIMTKGPETVCLIIPAIAEGILSVFCQCDIKLGTPAASLPSAWCYRVSTGSGWPGVSILWLGETESLVCRFYLSVAACKIEQIHPWDTLACCLDVKQPANKQTSCQRSTLCVGQQINIPVVLLSCV